MFHAYTNKVLKPKKTKAIAVPALYKLVGRKVLYRVIAKEEYKAAEKYEALVNLFDEVKSVQTDETRHGDTVLALLQN